MTNQYYEGYVAGYQDYDYIGKSPDWMAGYNQALEDKINKVVNSEAYERFHKET